LRKGEASRYGVQVLESELIVSSRERLMKVTPQYLMLRDFSEDRIIERHL